MTILCCVICRSVKATLGYTQLIKISFKPLTSRSVGVVVSLFGQFLKERLGCFRRLNEGVQTID